MKQITVALLLVSIAVSGYSQKKKLEEIVTATNDTIRKGDTLYFGNGINHDGSFRWVYTSSILVSPPIHITSAYTGLFTEVESLEIWSSAGMGEKKYAFFKVMTTRFMIDLDQAIVSKEILIKR